MDIITHHGQGKLQQIIEVGSHRLTADASVEAVAKRPAQSLTTCWRQHWVHVPR